jgi:hypothetical protein
MPARRPRAQGRVAGGVAKRRGTIAERDRRDDLGSTTSRGSTGVCSMSSPPGNANRPPGRTTGHGCGPGGRKTSAPTSAESWRESGCVRPTTRSRPRLSCRPRISEVGADGGPTTPPTLASALVLTLRFPHARRQGRYPWSIRLATTPSMRARRARARPARRAAIGTRTGAARPSRDDPAHVQLMLGVLLVVAHGLGRSEGRWGPLVVWHLGRLLVGVAGVYVSSPPHERGSTPGRLLSTCTPASSVGFSPSFSSASSPSSMARPR